MIKNSVHIAFWLLISLVVALLSCSKGDKALLPQDDVVAFHMNGADGWGNISPSKAVSIDKTQLSTMGFGVLAYYTKDEPWNSYDDKSTPNFMNNTRVSSSDGGVNWTYSPVKYWPHKQGEKLSFFAYAPYIADVDINTLALTHTVDNDVKKQLDLMWSYSVTTDRTYNPSSSNVTFNFRHALSRVGVTVKALTDDVAPMVKDIDIRVKKIVFTSSGDKTGDGAGVFFSQGILDIGNQGADPQVVWSNMSGTQKFTMDYKNFVGGDSAGFLLNNSNTDDALQLNAPDSYLMLIPQDLLSTGFNIYVEYEVKLYDREGHTYLSYTNRGYCTVNVNLQAGKSYSMNLSLGIKKFTLSVGVTAWKGGEDGDEIVINGLVDD